MSERAFEVFMELHRGLPRQGPGSAAATRQARAAVPGLPPRPRTLDVGCGPGAQTLDLARCLDGPIVAVDLHASFLGELRARAAAAGVAGRVAPVRADMHRLPFAPRSFDLVWSEGAIYLMGFAEGLRAWRPLLREGGCVAVSEATWLRSDPPDDLRRFWDASYPAMQDVGGNVRVAREAGYEVLAHFTLPASCWWEYYAPIEARLDEWLARRPGDEVVRACVDEERREIGLYRQYGEYYGYVFYVMRGFPEPGPARLGRRGMRA